MAMAMIDAPQDGEHGVANCRGRWRCACRDSQTRFSAITLIHGPGDAGLLAFPAHAHDMSKSELTATLASALRVWPNVRAKADHGGRQRKPGTVTSLRRLAAGSRLTLILP